MLTHHGAALQEKQKATKNILLVNNLQTDVFLHESKVSIKDRISKLPCLVQSISKVTKTYRESSYTGHITNACVIPQTLQAGGTNDKGCWTRKETPLAPAPVPHTAHKSSGKMLPFFLCHHLRPRLPLCI